MAHTIKQKMIKGRVLEKIQQKSKKLMLLNILRYIFSRPYLAALIVGSFIHAGKWLNFTFHGIDYYENTVKLIDHGLIFFVIDILMPYIIPFAVITISVKLAKIKEKEFYNTFPDMNPDIIIKCDLSGMPLYINKSAKIFLFENNISVVEHEALIPENITSINDENGELPCRVTHNIEGVKIEYLVSRPDNNSLFLSGRIIKN